MQPLGWDLSLAQTHHWYGIVICVEVPDGTSAAAFDEVQVTPRNRLGLWSPMMSRCALKDLPALCIMRQLLWPPLREPVLVIQGSGNRYTVPSCKCTGTQLPTPWQTVTVVRSTCESSDALGGWSRTVAASVAPAATVWGSSYCVAKDLWVAVMLTILGITSRLVTLYDHSARSTSRSVVWTTMGPATSTCRTARAGAEDAAGLGETEDVPNGVCVLVMVGRDVGVAVTVNDPVPVAAEVADAVGVGVGVVVAEAVRVADDVAVLVGVGWPVSVAVIVTVLERVAVWVVDEITVGVVVAETVDIPDGVAVAVVVCWSVLVAVIVPVPERVALSLADPVAVGRVVEDAVTVPDDDVVAVVVC